MFKRLLQNILEDIITARDNHEEYLRLQRFFKAQHAEPVSILEFMHMNYIPRPVKHFALRITDWINSFFSWWLDFHRLSFITVMLIVGIIIVVMEMIE